MTFDKLQMSELLGILLTDGSIWFKNSSNCFCIGLTNKSGILHQRFRELMNSLFGVTNFNWDKSGFGIPTQICRSKEAVLQIFSLINTCRTKSVSPDIPLKSCNEWNPVNVDGLWFLPISIPNFIKEDKECLVRFLRLAFDCDGFVNLSVRREKNGRFHLSRQVGIASHNPFMKEHFRNLLISLGFSNPRITEEGVIVSNKLDLMKFDKIVRFSDGVEVSRGFWKGFTKNFILSLLVKSFEWSKKFELQSFLSKEEVLNSIFNFVHTDPF